MSESINTASCLVFDGERNRVLIGSAAGPMRPTWAEASPNNPFGEVRSAGIYSDDGSCIASIQIISDDDHFERSIKTYSSCRTDRRLHCDRWIARAREFSENFVASYGDSLCISGAPVPFAWAEHNSPTGEPFEVCYLAWKSSGSGGVFVSAWYLSFECLGCLGCRNKLDDHSSRVYFIQGVCGGPVKIGYSVKPRARLATLQTANHEKLRILASMPGGASVERSMHRLFDLYRVRDGSEWFKPTHELMAFISELRGW